jgi:hypothetical protein
MAVMGWAPDRALPWVRLRPDSQRKAELEFELIKARSVSLRDTLPSNHQYLTQLHSKTGR